MRSQIWITAVVAACCGAAALAATSWGAAQVRRTAAEKYVLGPIAGATYIGSEACAACHEDAWAQWQKSGHSRVILDATEHPGAILGDFSMLEALREEESLPEFGPEDVKLVHGNMWNGGSGRHSGTSPASSGSPTRSRAGSRATGASSAPLAT